MQDTTRMNQALQPNSRFEQPGLSGSESAELAAWSLWDLMAQIYANRWASKNGNRPNNMWLAQIGSMSVNQLQRVCNACIERCASGNTWPPDLAEFVALVASCGGGVLGLSVDDVMAENTRWRNESYRYESAEAFPWKHRVLYHICTSLKRRGIDFRLTESELREQAVKELEYWEKRARSGQPIPGVRCQLAAPACPAGPTPAELAYAEYKRRKAEGLL